jgi:peroxiredoxin
MNGCLFLIVRRSNEQPTTNNAIFARQKMQKPMQKVLIIALLAAAACAPPRPELKTGLWRGVIDMQQRQLPFVFEVKNNGSQTTAEIRNADERLLLDEIYFEGDSVRMVLHIFDAELRARIAGDKLSGWFVKNYAPDSRLPFQATYNETFRFAQDGPANVDFSGRYQLTFSYDTVSYPAVGIFQQTGNRVTGTFLTPAGDYRYLEGNVTDQTMHLSAFDGNHAFIFEAHLRGDSLAGDFFSGKSGREKFKGIKNDQAALPDAEQLTYLKPGYERIDFQFPDLNGNTVSLSDERFRNKVVILQLFGSWCPNCMDETRFLADWHRRNQHRGVEIMGLAYERKADFTYAAERVRKMKERLNVGYDFVIAGTYNKQAAAETLPMLNHVLAFPTTIFIGKDGKVKHIHTGFSGPGTGVYYEQFVERFNQIVNEALQTGG